MRLFYFNFFNRVHSYTSPGVKDWFFLIVSTLTFPEIVGQRHHATVSIVHACTKNPEQITREADIVVTAAGVPNLIRSSWLKQGSVVIDVGTCPIEVILLLFH